MQRLACALYKRTEGNPFLLVTLVDDLVMRGVIVHHRGDWTIPTDPIAVTERMPTTLRHLIEKHLSLLAPEDQQLLLAASVTGGDFSAELIASAVSTMAVEDIDQRCMTLARWQQFLQPVSIDVRHNRRKFDRYTFRHSLSRKVCFDRLTASQQRQLHHRIGTWKEGVYGPRTTALAAELALHFDCGHDPQHAIHYYQQAAENAVRRYASQEAVAHLQRALRLLQELPDTPMRAEQELGLQFQLRVQLGRLKGEATPELKPVVQRIEALSQQVELTPQLFWAFTGVYLFYLIREELQKAHGLAQQRLQLAERFPSPLFSMAAHTELGIASFFLGEATAAGSHFQQAIALYDPHAPHPFFFDWEHGPPCYCYAALVAWQRGKANHAQHLIDQALSRSRTLHLLYMEAFTLNCATLLAVLCGQTDFVHERTTAAIDLATTQGFSGLVAMAQVYRGWAHAHNGSGGEVLQQMQHSMSVYQIGGGDAFRAAHLALYADACGVMGHPAEGLVAVEEALSLGQRTGGRYYEAELYRIRGELTLVQSQTSLGQVKTSQDKFEDTDPRLPTPDPQGEAEACFLKSIDIARHQQAKAWELRATVNLARLWRQQEKRAEAHSVLSDIYDQFTEGFDTKDLREAKVLLEVLTH